MSNIRHNSEIGMLKDQCICGHFERLGYNFRCFVGVPNEILDVLPSAAISSVSVANTLLAMASKQQWGWSLIVRVTYVTSLQRNCA